MNDSSIEANRCRVPAFVSNWHTHTYRCKHARGDVADYCDAAVSAGLSALGFSDHMPFPDSRWSCVRMSLAELPDYCAAIDRQRESFPQLAIHTGLECEYDRSLGAYYEDEFLGRNGIEYLVAAAHYFPLATGDERWVVAFDRGKHIDKRQYLSAYARYAIEAIGSGLFAFLAHPDLFGFFCESWDANAEVASRDIAQAARDMNVALEINTYGFRKERVVDSDGRSRPPYPWLPFWRVAAEEGVRTIINTDAHDPEVVASTVDEALALAHEAGITVDMEFTPFKNKEKDEK